MLDPYVRKTQKTSNEITICNGRCFNLSFINYRGLMLCVYRNSDHSVCVAKYDCIANKVGEILLDYRANITDPKLIEYNNKLKLIYSYPGYGLHLEYMEFADLLISDHKCSVDLDSRIRCLTVFAYDGYVKRREKSWTPFVCGNKLYFLYRRNPHIVVEYSEDIKAPVYRKEFDHGKIVFPREFDNEIRGNGTAVVVGDEVLVTFHNRIGDDYIVGYYMFQNHPPFRPTRMCRRPLLDGRIVCPDLKQCGLNKFGPFLGVHSNCVFPGGAIIENNKLLLSCGFNDFYNVLRTYDVKRLYDDVEIL